MSLQNLSQELNFLPIRATETEQYLNILYFQVSVASILQLL